MIKGSTYSLHNALRFVVLFIVSVCFVMGCSKPPDDPIPQLPPLVIPPDTIPTGVIENFSIDDTLIGYNTSTFARWLVTGSNKLTAVTFAGYPVGISGPFSTGRLKRDSLFVLAVNNGQRRSQMVHVADSITTKLYNDGMQLEKTKTEWYDTTTATKGWKDTSIAPENRHERLLFNLNGYISITNDSTNLQYSGGRLTVVDMGTQPSGPSNPGSPTVVRFRNIEYTLINFTVQSILATYTLLNANGQPMLWRDTFTYK